ncbi:MAG: OmpA family protein [Myxococcota bacterium]
MRTKGIVTTFSALLAGTLSTLAMASEPAAEGNASGSVSVGTKGAAAGGETAGDATGDAAPTSEATEGEAGAEGAADSEAAEDAEADRTRDRGDQEWIKRWAPERNMAEIGVYGGVLVPSRRLELFEPDPDLGSLQGFKEFNSVAPSLGARLGYYPIRFFGIEGEAGVMPTRTSDDLSATLWGMRLSLVGQLGLWSVTPFVLVGAGMLNVSSDRPAVGNDIDASVHFGGGVKFFLTRYTMLRLDVRDHITAARGVDNGVIHNVEALLGFSVTLGRKKAEPPKPIPDTDGDGILDPDDECPTVPGVPEYNGCPIPDTDGDGILDPDDECPETPGLEEFNGCPDTDGDGIRDLDDECPEEPGVPEYFGCPIPDTDEDGFLDPDDKCPLQPENKNGYQDEDGCCDVIPKEVKRFTGVIRGIYFQTNKAKIRKKSERVLREALKVFRDYPDFNVEIIGHTDSRGRREYNLDLSDRRAASVRQWMVDREIAPTRIITRGAGPDEPLAPNNSRRGRAKNRRIEFKLQGMPNITPDTPDDVCEEPSEEIKAKADRWNQIRLKREAAAAGGSATGTSATGTSATGTSDASGTTPADKAPTKPNTPPVRPK